MRNLHSNSYKILIGLILYSLLTIVCPSDLCYGQEMKNNSFLFYLNAPSMTILSPERADEIQIARNIWSADLGLEFRLFKYTGFTLGLGFGSAKDHNSFTQGTTMGEKESSFNVAMYELKVGFWTPDIAVLKERDLVVNFRANAVFDGMAGKREIDDCVDCGEEKFRIDGGLSVEPEIDFFFFQNFVGLGFAYRYYFLESDIQHKLVLLKLMLRLDF